MTKARFIKKGNRVTHHRGLGGFERTPEETARLLTLKDELDPLRTFSVTRRVVLRVLPRSRAIIYVDVPFTVRALNGAEASGIADEMKRDMERDGHNISMSGAKFMRFPS